MRVFVSVDIEGACGVTAWEEARKGSPGHAVAARQMAAEASAACEGAFAGGATEVVVKDAHGDGRNLVPADLPAPARLLRAYNGHPFAMVQGLDGSFALALFVGYHSRGGSGGNPLAHTLSSRLVHEVRVDGEPVSEYRLHAWAAGLVDVPVALVTGDAALCDEVTSTSPGTEVVVVKEGTGASTLDLHPGEAVGRIRSAAERVVTAGPGPALTPPGPCRLEVAYKDPALAYARSWYPGASLVAPAVVGLDVSEWFEALRALVFLVGK